MRTLNSLLSALLLVASVTVNAQRLPSTQQTSLRAPANIKIDGKTTEWDNKFQANNHNVDLLYTISNDDDNLYLIAQSTYPDVAKHILNGGLTFVVNPSDKKKDPQAVSITYPTGNRVFVNFHAKPAIIPGNARSVFEADSFMNVYDQKIKEQWKMISTTGMKGIDTLISIYNEDGIKAAALFDNQMVYTYELSISLKDLGLVIDKTTPFAYHIIINEVQEHGITMQKDTQGKIVSIRMELGAQQGQSATDFWGEYKLAKK